jgi:hypothetical protein
MKKLLLLGLATILFVSCQQNYSRTGPEVDIVKELFDDYHNGNWESWMSKYADTAKIHHNVPDGKGVNAAQQRENFKTLLEPLSSYKFDDDIWFEQVITDEGETWVNVWGEWHGVVAANNKEIIIPVHLTAQVEEGLIRKEFVYYDPSELQNTLAELAAVAVESTEEEHAEGDED